MWIAIFSLFSVFFLLLFLFFNGVFLSVERTFDDVLQRFRKKKCKWGFTPIYFLTHND